MKKMGRTHRPFFRVCATDQRNPRDGRVIEELGYYDPMCPETDARAILKGDRIDYWLSVGAQPSDKMSVLIKKYGTEGTHLDKQKEALERLGTRKNYTPPPPSAEPAAKPEPAQEAVPAEAESADAEATTEEAATE
ncbi:MAG: 30S ribosomal protein S16 [Planctomycetota bacterium]